MNKILGIVILTFCLEHSAIPAVNNPLEKADKVPECFESDPNAVWHNKANCSDWGVRKNFKYLFQTNSQGFRDREFRSYPEKKTIRILFIGASTILGPGLAVSDTVPKVLERELKKLKIPAEVINGSTDGYLEINHAERVNDYINIYHPNMILFSLGSDIKNALYLDDVSLTDNSISPLHEVGDWIWHSHLPPSFSQFLWKSGALGAYRTLIYMSRRMVKITLCKFKSTEEERGECLMDANAKIVNFIKNKVTASNIKFIAISRNNSVTTYLNMNPNWNFMLTTIMDALTPSIQISHPIFNRMLQKLNISFIVPAEESFYHTLPNDYHFNKDGAKLFAKDLAKQLKPILLKMKEELRKKSSKK